MALEPSELGEDQFLLNRWFGCGAVLSVLGVLGVGLAAGRSPQAGSNDLLIPGSVLR